MEAVETLSACLNLIRSRFVDINTHAGEPTDAAARVIIDPDAPAIPNDLMRSRLDPHQRFLNQNKMLLLVDMRP